MDQWRVANPKLASAADEKARIRGTQQTDNPLMNGMRSTLPMNSPSVQSPEVAKLGAGNQSLTKNPNAFKAEPLKIVTPEKKTPINPTGAPKRDVPLWDSYEYNSYDLVLEYLFDNGHADTIAEAEYLMTELDESFIQSLVETYHANLLAEEVEAWVNELVEEGYDLSEYTWDDMVDHYFSDHK
jgi:hypothetical protein